MKHSDLPAEVEYEQRIAIGANNPPEPTPFDIAKERLDDLFLESSNYLDGAKIETADIAAAVEQLESDLKAAIKAADSARSGEYAPLNEKKAEIQKRYDPIIGGSKCDGGIGGDALEACRKALTPWRIEQQRLKDEAAQKARDEAERLRLAAIAAHQTADAANLSEKRAADALAKGAATAAKVATRAEKAVNVKTGLRVTFSAEITDVWALSAHVWENDPDGLREMMLGWAQRTVASFGANAEGMKIPGCNINKHVESK